ncbi:ribokinase [Pectinatus haikarae]|uniref:Deoxyribokinase n=1 Tax=Pectinatus haikarae TaxID=349096 RepID=A0ABT9YB16_9FIRM|nr:ribokinase [Pectinatus haikarae]MDQ0204992.1 ribokinase [Pectinatus haikarae]
MRIAVIGSVMIDLVSYADKIPEAGETKEADDFFINCGGKGANQAIAAAKSGADVMMIAKVGDDMFGKTAMRNFSQYNVDTAYVTKVPGVGSGMAAILVDASAQNRILIYKGANLHLQPADIEKSAEALKKCSLLILQLEIPLETVCTAIEFAGANNIPILLNPAPACKELPVETACKCDFFVPNETELAILTGMPVSTDDEILAASEKLIKQGMKNVIVTMGEKGSLWMDAKHCEKIAPFKVVPVDTTGAGDAFIGSFAASYVEKRDIPLSMRRGSAFAAMSVMKKGAQISFPVKEELEDFIQADN